MSCVASNPYEVVGPTSPPNTIEEWKAVADGLLNDQGCVFHRNAAISSHYAWIYSLQPTYFKWAAMAAIASHHVRLALSPLRLHADHAGYVDIPRSIGHRRLLPTADVNMIRATNNAIYDDIFWVHLAYITAEHGIEHLRALLHAERHYAPVLAGFEAIDAGRRVMEDATASADNRRMANELIWAGNLQLLEHEQRAVVQPNFDRLSSAFAKLISIGSATTFEVRGLRQELTFFTSFYLYSLSRGVPQALRTRAFPRITRFDDRWRWLAKSVVPRFRRFSASTHLVDASLQRIVDVSREYASTPCAAPHPEAGRQLGTTHPCSGNQANASLGTFTDSSVGAHRKSRLAHRESARPLNEG